MVPKHIGGHVFVLSGSRDVITHVNIRFAVRHSMLVVLWNQASISNGFRDMVFIISSLLHSVNLILFTVLLVHLILRISPHHSHHLRSHNLSLRLPFTPDLKLISFTNPFLHSHSYSFRTDFTDLNLY